MRPHHLLCLLTYAGKGYSPAFVANYDAIAARIAAGEAIEVVAGPDDVCAPMLNDASAHCRQARVTERDLLAARDVAGLLDETIKAGTRLTLDRERLSRMREAFATGAIRAACPGCEWHGLCSDISAGGYANIRIRC